MSGTRLRLAVKALEHPLGMARFALAKPDVIHVQWLGAPELDRWLFRPRSPAVLTAHDIIPRRTLSKTAMWRALFDRFERVVVHSERGRGQLVDFGAPGGEAPRHPAIPSSARTSTGATTGGRRSASASSGRTREPRTRSRRCFGVDDARLLVVGDPRVPLDGLQQTAGDRAEWRLGYLPDAELRRALSEATVALFPYRAEIDVSGALLQVLGAGVPAIVYDIGGLGEVVGPLRRRASSCRPATIEAMSHALRRLLDDDDALAAARAGRRAGARRADLGGVGSRPSRAVLGDRVIRRRGRFHELVERQLDLFEEDEAELLEEADEADAAWTNADADETEELYGDYQLVVDAIGERLYDIRESYARSLDEPTAREYRVAFDRAVEKRFGRYATFVEEISSGAHRGLRAHRRPADRPRS